MAHNFTSQTFSSRRVEALTDGVFAIAMTILVLDLHAPVFIGKATEHSLWSALGDEAGSIIVFVLTFLLLAGAWSVHQRQFDVIERSDRHLTFLNTLRLLLIVLVPYTLSLADKYNGLTLGTIWFPLNFALIGAMSLWQWKYATTAKPRLVSDRVSDKDIALGNLRNQITIFVSLLVAAAVPLVQANAFFLYALTPFFMNYATRRSRS